MAAKPGRYGWAKPVEVGRKFCAKCGRWRHVCDFQCRRRFSDGSPALTTRCTTCLRLDLRETVARDEVRERRREYQRIWTHAKRREQGVPERQWGHKAKRETGSQMQRLKVEPFRKAVADAGMSTMELSKRMRLDDRQVSRILGLAPNRHVDRRYDGEYSKHISYANAVKIVLALNLDPVDFGI